MELLLAALASCVSIGLVTQAAKRGLDFQDFEIDVRGDLDLRGYLGLDDRVRAGYENVEYVVRVKTDVPAEVVEDMLRAGERTSPMWDNIRNGIGLTSRVEVVAPDPAEPVLIPA